MWSLALCIVWGLAPARGATTYMSYGACLEM